MHTAGPRSPGKGKGGMMEWARGPATVGAGWGHRQALPAPVPSASAWPRLSAQRAPSSTSHVELAGVGRAMPPRDVPVLNPGT